MLFPPLGFSKIPSLSRLSSVFVDILENYFVPGIRRTASALAKEGRLFYAPFPASSLRE